MHFDYVGPINGKPAWEAKAEVFRLRVTQVKPRLFQYTVTLWDKVSSWDTTEEVLCKGEGTDLGATVRECLYTLNDWARTLSIDLQEPITASKEEKISLGQINP